MALDDNDTGVVGAIAGLAGKSGQVPTQIDDVVYLPEGWKETFPNDHKDAVHIVPVPTVFLHTLQGLVDFVKSGIDGDQPANGDFTGDEASLETFVQIVGPMEVVYATATHHKGGRHIIASAVFEPLLKNENHLNFRYGQWMEAEAFTVSLQALFEDSGDREKVLGVIGNMRAEKVVQRSDDGVTQTVTAKQGVAMSQEVAVPNPVELAPFRTFPEVEQPLSRFVLRVKNPQHDEALPLVALFPADGTAWRLEAIKGIRDFLAPKLGKDVTLVG